MSKRPLALVCAVALLAGGAAGLVFTYIAPQPARVQGVAVTNAGEGSVAAAEVVSAAGSTAGEASAEGVAASAEGGPAPRHVEAGEESSHAEGDIGGAVKPSGGASVRPAGWSAVESRRAARGYSRTTRERAAAGGQSIAGHAVGGVKKTGAGVKRAGAAIGKTFGKIGGIFND